MPQGKICLASDNWSSTHPLIIHSLVEANEGFAPSYGSDRWTEEACALIQAAFKTQGKVFIVPSGTGANILCLKIACRRHESVLCTDIAHIYYQEAGAAESLIGCKLLPIPHTNGKVTPDALLKKLKTERAFGKHSTSPRVLSLTQPTEVGTLYSLEELSALSKLCKQENLLLHIDGSRIYNAAAALGISLHAITQASQADLLSLGGTKNGLMGAEALVIFNHALQEGSDHLHKQTLQLMSKMRYLSTQYIPFFKNELWRSLAAHANQKAQAIGAILQSIPQVTLSYPLETNQIFLQVPFAWLAPLQESIFCHLWDPQKKELRFITSWNTSDEVIEGVRTTFSKIVKQGLDNQ